MKRLTAACALACALTFTTTASAVEFGANDDTGKYAADGGAAFFAQMRATGLTRNVMTVRWTPGSTAIPDASFLDRAVPAAVAAGIEPIFAHQRSGGRWRGTELPRRLRGTAQRTHRQRPEAPSRRGRLAGRHASRS